MSTAEVASLAFPRFRDGTGKAPLPESLKRILLLDRNFSLKVGGAPLMAPVLESLARTGTIPSQNVDAIMRGWFATQFDRIPKDISLWMDAGQPALVEISHSGDQRLFFYVSNLDGNGEYPLVRLTDEPELFLSEAHLPHYLFEVTERNHPLESHWAMERDAIAGRDAAIPRKRKDESRLAHMVCLLKASCVSFASRRNGRPVATCRRRHRHMRASSAADR